MRPPLLAWLVPVALATSCGGAHHAPPPPVLSNRTAVPAPRVTSSRHDPLVLWCTTPTGVECRRAATELGVAHTPTAALPTDFFDVEWRDLDDDCVDPDLGSLLHALGTALGVARDGWVDQGGAPSRDGLANVAHGGGCTNRTVPGVPDVKVQLATTPTGLIALVRVWELEDTQ